MVFLEFQPEALSSSRGCDGDFREPLVLPQGNLRIPLKSLQRNGASSRVEAGNSGLFSSCNSDLGFPFRVSSGESGINSC